MSETILESIAIIGVHGRFPGAASVDEFWNNLVAGRESLSVFTDSELQAAGLDPAALHRSGQYVPARGVLKDAECFDAAFFGIHPKEAEVMDPQHRVFLEACWEALERAGYAPGRIKESVGVYGGATFNTYYLNALHPRADLRELVGHEQVMLGNEKDYLATRVAYKLNLRGPAISLNTACSSSLVAVCQACQSLLTYQCDMALAGGVSVAVPQQRGYFFQEGNIGSPDGHTRTFDARAQGTLFSNGVTLVVLKRLSEAVADGDQIYAVIKGAALNNDGAERASFGAPGVAGQSEVVSMAQELAGFEPDSISYIEAHGTATPIGDPIEVAALTKAFRRATQRKQFCALGSVKSNLGHLDAAAGTAGLIKTALALKHRLIPPTLHFQTPNPELDLENSPFFVNATLREWKPEQGGRLRAGVSSFGTGGTNAHVVREEAPVQEPSGPARPSSILLLSAKTGEALEACACNLAAYLKAQPGASLADVAYTLQVGRGEFTHRRAVICQTVTEAIALLEKPDPRKVLNARQLLKEPPVVFMFPGQGAQYAGMGADVYRQEVVFRECVDRCAQILRPLLGQDLRPVLFPEDGNEAAANEQLRQTRLTQPALFTVEYALAMLWMSWGIKPAAMIGHSVGEYVAGCLAGVFSLETALTLVARRAELVQAQAPGSMLAVRLPEAEVRTLLNEKLSIAAINSPNLCVVSGPHDAISALEQQLSAKGVAAKHLQTSHAFHSAMMEPVLAPFTDLLRKTHLSAPQIPYVSNVTAQWVTAEDATRPEYWAGHVRQTVRFADGVAELMKDPRQVLLEVGPGQTLAQLARQHPARKEDQLVVSTLGGARDQELPNLLAALSRLWLAGVALDWKGYYEGERRRRVVLPTYPFDRKRYWPDSPITALAPTPTRAQITAEAQSAEPAAAVPLPAPPTKITAQPVPAVSRQEHLTGIIRSLLQELSGTNLENVGAEVGFLEIGLDSLLLTQAATLFQRKFGVPVSFRQLMEDLSTTESLAAYMDAKLPTGAFAPVTVPVAAPAVTPTAQAAAGDFQLPAVPAGASANALEQLLHQHLQMTTQLLTLVRNQSGALPSLPPTPAPIPAATAPTSPAKGETKSHGPFRPAERGGAGGLTGQQQGMLDGLIARYTKRTGGSKRLAERNRPCLADPRSASGFKQLWKEMVYPIYTARSEGSKVWDVDGNEYVDFVMGFGASLFGHRPPFVVEAIKRQLELGFEIGPIQPLVGETAALVCEMTGMERAAFCNTGSEAVLAAMRLARTVTGRDRIAMFSGAYHGIFDEVLARPLTVNGEMRAAPIAPGIPQSGTSEVIVFDWGNPESLELIRRRGHELAAVLVEPVQSRRLDLQPREFLQELRRITEQTGTALIFDEVVTGFRVQLGGAQAFYGIRADLATYGKVVGGGLPIGVVTGQARFLDALDGGKWQFGDASFPEAGVTFFAGTFVRHPITMAAAKAVLEHLKREGPELQERVAALAGRTAGRVRELIDRYQAPLHLAQFSSMMYLTVQPEFKHGGLLFYLLRERGIHIWENRSFVFTTAHTEADVNGLVKALAESLEELVSGGFLPRSTGSLSGGTTATAASASLAASSANGQLNLGPQELELTKAQGEMWLAALLDQNAARSFNVTLILNLKGELNREALESAWQELTERHGSLRTAFDLENPIQRIAPAIRLAVSFTDLTGSPADQREKEFSRLRLDQTEPLFDLTKAPLARLRLIKKDENSHALILTVNHLIADGWSIGVLLHEFKLIYAARCQGKPAFLEPALQMPRYVEILRTAEHLAETQKAEAYWKSIFANPPVPLELPADRVRPPRKTYVGSRETVCWDREFTQRLRKGSAQQKTTLLNFLLACFGCFVHRLTGQDDFVIGIPSAGQISPGLENTPGSRALVGHCVNTLPLRIQCDKDATFAQYLKSVKRTLLDAYEHQNLTFGRLLQILSLSRDPSRLPLVSVLFNVDRAVSGFQLPGLQTEVNEVTRSALVFDVSINIVDFEDALHVDFDFNTDLFDHATVRRWLNHFRTLLESVLQEPDRQVKAVALLDETESRRVLEEWNQTQASYPRDQTVHGLIEAQARRTPQSVAVEFGNERLTYAELNQRADEVAVALRSLGVRKNGLTGICIERSLDMMIAVLGTLKSGGAYVPLDPAFPQERLALMVEDSRMPVILTQRKLLDLLPSTEAMKICMDEPLPIPAPNDKAVSTATTAAPTDLAYVLFTSGSTGRPKGVQIEHRAVVNFLASMGREPGLKPEDSLLAITTLSFDIAGLELFLPLTIGAKVMIAPRDITVDGPRLVKLLKDSGASVMQATPATWRMLIESGWHGDQGLKVLCGGEAFDRDLVEKLLERCGELWNMYGPTETTIWSTTERLLPGQPITIGRPIANTTVYLLGGNSQPVPVGVVGELFIGGEGVARGYLNRPELTSERFVPDPFDSKRTGRLYRTGDLARFRSDGKIEFLGRADQQVKIRGFRIELGEIETALARLEGVAQAAVVAREDTPGDKRLVAYLVANVLKPALQAGELPVTSVPLNNKAVSGAHDPNASGLNTSSLRAALRTTLPEYMVPSTFVFLAALPLTPNGKVDRKALPPPEGLGSDSNEEFEAPRGATEEKLAGIMASLLKLPRVGRKDDFFDLGGHSILAVTLFNEIERVFGERLPLATLFRAPTIEQLAPALEAKKPHPGKWASLVAIQPKGSKPRFFCVHGAGGNILLYRDLANRFGEDYPFYGIQSQGLDGVAPPLATVEEMAETYCREIRELQPTGPYCLGGYCLGGTIAYEIAQRLRREGHEVPLVALLDTYNFSQMKQSTMPHFLRQKLAFHLSTLFHLGLKNWPGYFNNKLRVARDGEFSSLWKAFIRSFRKDAAGQDPSSSKTSVPELNDQAATAYQPKPYAGRVTVFKPKVNYDFYPDPQMGWGEVAIGGVEVVELSANPHALLVAPYVSELARELQRRLDAVVGLSGPVDGGKTLGRNAPLQQSLETP